MRRQDRRWFRLPHTPGYSGGPRRQLPTSKLGGNWTWLRKAISLLAGPSPAGRRLANLRAPNREPFVAWQWTWRGHADADRAGRVQYMHPDRRSSAGESLGIAGWLASVCLRDRRSKQAAVV